MKKIIKLTENGEILIKKSRANMAKNVTHLTESELNQHIHKAIAEALEEITGKQFSIIPNSTINSVNNIQNGKSTETITSKLRGTRTTSYDDKITRANSLRQVGIDSLLSPFKNFTFMFWAYQRLGNIVHLTFRIENIVKLLDNIAILKGEVVFGQAQLDGDIIVEFKMQKDGQYAPFISYKHKEDRHKYALKPDVRTERKWNALIKELFDSLSSRLDRGI